MDQDICYFFTDTIYQFKPLLENDDLKRIVINSWKYLADKGLIVVYGYVIMPNHVHLLWNMLERMAEKARPQVSLNTQHISSENI